MVAQKEYVAHAVALQALTATEAKKSSKARGAATLLAELPASIVTNALAHALCTSEFTRAVT